MSDRLTVSSRMHTVPITNNTRIIAFVAAGMVYSVHTTFTGLETLKKLVNPSNLDSRLQRPTNPNAKPCGPSRSGAIPIKASRSDSKS